MRQQVDARAGQQGPTPQEQNYTAPQPGRVDRRKVVTSLPSTDSQSHVPGWVAPTIALTTVTAIGVVNAACAAPGSLGEAAYNNLHPAPAPEPTPTYVDTTIKPTTLEVLLNRNDPGALLSVPDSQLTADQLAKKQEVEHNIDNAIKNTEFDVFKYVETIAGDVNNVGKYWTNPDNPVLNVPSVVRKNFELKYISAVKLPGINTDGTTSINGKDYWEYAVKRLNQATGKYEYKVFYVGEDNIANDATADPSTLTGLDKIYLSYTFDNGHNGHTDPQYNPQFVDETTAAGVGKFTNEDNYSVELLSIFASDDKGILASGRTTLNMTLGQQLIDYLSGKTNRVPNCMLTLDNGVIRSDFHGISVGDIGLNARILRDLNQ